MHTDLIHLQRYHESGDAGEFQSLVKHHASMVFATARRVTCDSSLAEDVAQETFLELARKGRSIKDSVGAWLHRVAWRRACDVVRSERTRQRYESELASVERGRECTWEELEPAIDEAISELAGEERTVIIEHYLEGRSQKEVALHMGLSQSSVSRLLDKSVEQLRLKLKGKGLFCGVALGGMLSAASSHAAPASLVASLNKIGLSNIGTGTGAATTGTLGALTGLSFTALVTCGVVLVACVLAVDLASKESHVSQWLSADQAGQATQNDGTGKKDSDAINKARLLAEAKEICAKKPKASKAEMERLMLTLVFEKDVEKKFAALHSVGLFLSRESFDRVIARHPNIHLYDERRAGEAMAILARDLWSACISEMPREVVVWSSHFEDKSFKQFPALVALWARSHPKEWAAFIEASPDASLGDYAKLWIEELDDPGSIWGKARKAGIDLQMIQESVDSFLLAGGWPDEALFKLILSSPDEEKRGSQIVGMALNLTNGQLLEAANSGAFHDVGLINTLRAMGGDPNTVYDLAAVWVKEAANGGGHEGQRARWVEKMVGRFYAEWLKVDPKAALQHSKRSQNQILLESFMKEAAQSSQLTESMIVEAFTSAKNREHSLAAYYLAKANNNPEVALQSIMNSAYVEDQIESAKQVLDQWALKSAPEAAAWLAQLPASEDRLELIAVVTSRWAKTAPEEAFAFAHEHGARLAHGWGNGLAWGARDLPEETLSGMFATYDQDPQYNGLVLNIAEMRYANAPEKALKFISKFAKPGWEKPFVRDMSVWLGGDDARADDFAKLLPTLDLSQVDPQIVVKVAELYVSRRAGEGRLQEAITWTRQLPDEIGAHVRAQASSLSINGNR